MERNPDTTIVKRVEELRTTDPSRVRYLDPSEKLNDLFPGTDPDPEFVHLMVEVDQKFIRELEDKRRRSDYD